LIGFKCDEGIRRNKGRIGAKDGPEWIRKACSNLANHFKDHTLIIDIGDISCEDNNLEAAQEEFRKLVSKINSFGYFIFGFGGGHEIAFPHYMGLLKNYPKNKTIGIINIDAHFDLRLPEEKASSGTPFYQIAMSSTEIGLPFNYFVVGIQKYSNTQALFRRADELGVHYIYSHDLKEHNLHLQKEKIKQFIQQVDAVFLTICMDVFDISVAPGVSAPSVIGLQPFLALELIKEIVKSGKLISANIAELNPSVDQDDKTSKLASKLIFEIITDYQAMI
jgi:formiminoglutamase